MSVKRPQLMLRFTRSVSNKVSENVLLADALNLLSPVSRTSKVPEIKPPSLIENLTKGPMAERILEGQKHIPEVKRHDFNRTVRDLMQDLSFASSLELSNDKLVNASEKQLKTHIRNMTSQMKLSKLTKLLFYQNRLTFAVLMEIILNRNLQDLNVLPFDMDSVPEKELTANGWKPIHFKQLKVALLKKYHDLKQPLLIVRNLKQNFVSTYLPLISSQKLSPFYERIVWKFHFDYSSESELSYIKQLNSFRSTMLIWESSMKSEIISRFALEYHGKDLNQFQKAFLTLCGCESAVKTITSQIKQTGTSKALSELKKISIKFKLYNMASDLSAINSDTRATYYLLVNAFEETIVNNFSVEGCVEQALQEVRSFKENTLMKKVTEEVAWDTNFMVVEQR